MTVGAHRRPGDGSWPTQFNDETGRNQDTHPLAEHFCYSVRLLWSKIDVCALLRMKFQEF